MVTDEKFSKFMKFILDIIERVRKGSLDPDAVMNVLRPLIGQGKGAIIRTLKHLAFKEVVTVQANSVKRDDFLDGKLGWTLYKGYGFDKIEAELKHDTISCPTHSREVFTLKENMYDDEIQAELSQPPYPTVEEVIASFTSRINMWMTDKNSNHGLITNGYANIEHARMSDGRIVLVSCYFGDGGWDFDCSEFDVMGNWNGGFHFSCVQAL